MHYTVGARQKQERWHGGENGEKRQAKKADVDGSGRALSPNQGSEQHWMVDTVSSKRRSEIMSGIRSTGMKPEMRVRQQLHAEGYRYRLHRRDLPGKPDLVFPARRKVIFVHGCFWHQHGDPGCRIARRPKSNQEYWLPKLERNVARDTENMARLLESGWEVLVIWECEVRKGPGFVRKAAEFLDGV